VAHGCSIGEGHGRRGRVDQAAGRGAKCDLEKDSFDDYSRQTSSSRVVSVDLYWFSCGLSLRSTTGA
jgi:hypothetical protein